MAELVYWLIYLPLGAVLEGSVIKLLWGWFVAAPFSVQQMTVAQAVGIDCLVAMFMTLPVSSAKDRKTPWVDKWKEAAMSRFARVVMVLVIGYIAHRCM
jgi:hypothetical protein